LLRGQDSNL